MKTTEDLFRKSIEQYKRLISDISDLNNSLAVLTPETIYKRCEKLQKFQSNQAKVDEFIVGIMNDIGYQILQESYVYEYQQLIDMARKSSNEIATKTMAIRKQLEEEL